MKCRKWGHFTNACLAETNTCGTCGGDHRTKECTTKDKVHCVSCNSDLHPSWDRDCPKFLQRHAQYDENYPENELTYFPTGEDWMLTPQPSKVPLSEKFLQMYNVNPIPTCQPPQPQMNGQPSRQCRQKAIKLPPNQNTMDRYITAGSSQPHFSARENYTAHQQTLGATIVPECL